MSNYKLDQNLEDAFELLKEAKYEQSPAEKFRLINETMKNLLDASLEIIKEHSPKSYDRAKAYWYAHISISLSSDHEYIDKYTPNMMQEYSCLPGAKDEEDLCEDG